MNIRTERMLDQAPDYYQQARSFIEIQDTVAQELNKQEIDSEDLKAQLRVVTATWGLRYWEEAVGLPIRNTTDYELRRSRVLGRLRSGGSFSASMLKAVAEAYTQRPVTVEVDVKAYQVYMYLYHEFLTEPSFFVQIDNIIHAHLGIEYRVVFQYDRSLELRQDYKRWRYPFLIVDTFLVGTEPDGPSTLGRIYKPIQELSKQYYQNQQAYKFAGFRVAGSVNDFKNLQLDRSRQQTVEQTYQKHTNVYTAIGEAIVGEFFLGDNVQHKNLSVSSHTTREIQVEYNRSVWNFKLCGRINAGQGVYV